MATARELFDDYNFYRAHTRNVQEIREKGQPIRFMKETPERLALLARMAAWCGGRGFEPRHWLCWLFYRGHWRFARPFNQLIPGSTKTEKSLLAAYARVKNLPMYDQRIRQITHMERVDAEQIYDGNRDLAATTEALKRRYLRMGDPEGCLEDERANGYHPRSFVCARCALAQPCERRLQSTARYDIVALRDGRLTAAQACLGVGTHV